MVAERFKFARRSFVYLAATLDCRAAGSLLCRRLQRDGGAKGRFSLVGTLHETPSQIQTCPARPALPDPCRRGRRLAVAAAWARQIRHGAGHSRHYREQRDGPGNPATPALRRCGRPGVRANPQDSCRSRRLGQGRATVGGNRPFHAEGQARRRALFHRDPQGPVAGATRPA
ncbi:hypothetical protein D3C84_690220 [compost metagenome]